MAEVCHLYLQKRQELQELKQRSAAARVELLVLETSLIQNMKDNNVSFLRVVIGNETKKLKTITKKRRIPLTYREFHAQLTVRMQHYFTGFKTDQEKHTFFTGICDQIWGTRRINTEEIVDLLPRPKPAKPNPMID